MFALFVALAQQDSPVHWWAPGSRGEETSWNQDCAKNVEGCRPDRENPPDYSPFLSSPQSSNVLAAHQ